MQRARWVAITRPLYKQHSLRASKRRCGKRKSRGIYIIRRVVASTRTRSSGQACRFQASLHRTMSSDSDTYSPCTTMEPCVAVTLKVNVALALCRIMNNADRTKKTLRKEGVPKANLEPLIKIPHLGYLVKHKIGRSLTSRLPLRMCYVCSAPISLPPGHICSQFSFCEISSSTLN